MQKELGAPDRLLLALLLLLNAGLGCWGTGAESILLRPAERLQDSGATLCPGSGYAIPCVTDWNGDGKKDLLVGYQPAGKIALYLNLGTDAQPRFTNFTNLKTGAGSELCHPSGGCGAPAPWVGDCDADGKRDLLVGAGADGTVWFYRNTNTDTAPILAPGQPLKVGTAALSVSLRATPCIADWDQDGLPDLLCGSGEGYVFFFNNTNTVHAPVYAPAVRLKAGGMDLALGIRSVARVFDWDGDGLKDLVCSSDTGVYWCRNTNPNYNSAPTLQLRQAIQVPIAGLGLVALNTGGRMRLDLVDWNHDGVMDLLLGNLNGTVNYFEGYHLRIHSLAPEAAGRATLAWDSAPFLKYHVLAGPALDCLTNLAAANLSSGGKTTAWTIETGASPRFYRIQIAP